MKESSLNIYKAELLSNRDDAFTLIWNHNREIGRMLSDDELVAGVDKFISIGNPIGIVENHHLIAFLVLYCRHYDTLEAYICNVYVLPEYRGRCLSGLLLEKAFEIALDKGFRSVQLHVDENNVSAIRVYRKYGFVPNGNYQEKNGKKQIEMVVSLADYFSQTVKNEGIVGRKKIMILGTGDAQLRLIKEAKALGYFTIVCGLRPERESAKVADIYYEVDYENVEEVYAIARKENIDGIISNAEPAMVTVAYVSQKMHLIGNSVESVETLVSKSKFRKLQRNNGFFAPEHYVVNSYEELLEKAKIIQFPVIIKPTESTGTQGTTRLDEYDDIRIVEVFDKCKAISRNGQVSIEQFVPMSSLRVCECDIVVIGDDILWDGMFWTDRAKEMPMLPRTDIFPMILPHERKKELQRVIENILKTAGIRHGEYNVEAYFTDKDEVFVIEINPRQGGNYIPQLIEQHTGVNLSRLIVSTAVGDLSYYHEVQRFQRLCRYVSLHMVFAKEEGILREVFISTDIQPYIKWIEQKIPNGAKVRKGANAFDVIAWINIQFDSYEQQHHFVDDIEAYIYPIVVDKTVDQNTL